MPVLISPTESAREGEPGQQDSSRTAQSPGFSDGSKGPQIFHGPIEAVEADHQTRQGMRVLRTSPVILISCGLVFVSLIFLLDYATQTGAHTGQTAERRTTPANQEKIQAVPASTHDNSARANVPVPQPEPPLEAAADAPAGQAASDIGKEDEEVEKQSSAPAPDPPASTDAQASKVDVASPAAPQSEDGFTLQVGSFNEQGQAQERVVKLGSVGVTAYVARVEIPGRGTWYRVQTGYFKSREEAVRFGTQLRSTGAVADFIVTPSRAA